MPGLDQKDIEVSLNDGVLTLAQFKNGVLTITLPKRPEAQRQVKRIPISAG